MIFIIINTITTIFIGLIFNKIFEVILFMITYIPIRVYAGGYHSRTKLGYYIFSVLMLVNICYTLKFNLLQNSSVIIILFTISSSIILYLAPVEDKNKPLDEIETKVYKKRTIRNLIIVLSILCITLILNKINIYTCICVSLVCNNIMVILGKYKLKIKKEKCYEYL